MEIVMTAIFYCKAEEKRLEQGHRRPDVAADIPLGYILLHQ
jgi:hypothetical protein